MHDVIASLLSISLSLSVLSPTHVLIECYAHEISFSRYRLLRLLALSLCNESMIIDYYKIILNIASGGGFLRLVMNTCILCAHDATLRDACRVDLRRA
jgi:hypothetical protein